MAFVLFPVTDFTRFSNQIRESGMKVIGIGEQKNTKFIHCCCNLICIHRSLDGAKKKEPKKEQQLILKPSPKSLNKVDLQTIELIESTIEDIGDDSDA
jgi:hypothetical protein